MILIYYLGSSMMFNPWKLMSLMLKTRPMKWSLPNNPTPAPARIPRRFPKMHRRHFAICLYLGPIKTSAHSGENNLALPGQKSSKTRKAIVFQWAASGDIRGAGWGQFKLQGKVHLESRRRYPKYFTHPWTLHVHQKVFGLMPDSQKFRYSLQSHAIP